MCRKVILASCALLLSVQLTFCEFFSDAELEKLKTIAAPFGTEVALTPNSKEIVRTTGYINDSHVDIRNAAGLPLGIEHRGNAGRDYDFLKGAFRLAGSDYLIFGGKGSDDEIINGPIQAFFFKPWLKRTFDGLSSSFTDNVTSAESVATLEGRKLPSVELLDFSAVSPAVLHQLDFTAFPNLRVLALPFASWGEWKWTAFPESLEDLTIYNQRMTTEVWQSIAALPNLKTLRLFGCHAVEDPAFGEPSPWVDATALSLNKTLALHLDKLELIDCSSGIQNLIGKIE